MMKIRTSIFLSLTILSGFFVSAQGTYVVDSIVFGNSYRNYLLYVPASYSAGVSVPVVINLHDTGSDGNQQMQYGNFNKIADTANFIVALPEATGQTSFWNAGLQSDPDEAAFLKAMIDTIKKDFSIDPDRIYTAGFGNGGVMSIYLMCSLNARIAAYASVSGSMYGNWFFTCAPSRAVPLIMINGTADVAVPYNGNTLFVPVDSVIKKWSRHNKCQANSSVNVPDTNVADGCHPVFTRYSNGIDGSAVELFRIENGSHSWPNGPPYVPNTNYDMDASVEIWRFFRKFSLKQFSTAVGIKKQHSERLAVYPNPVLDLIYTPGLSGVDFIICASDGSVVKTGVLQNSLEIADLLPGVYVLVLKKNNLHEHYRFIKE